ncbi:antibiotic biosynthesis monooxygenase [Pantoea sp. EKM21T]|uniref:putative quinol monooxygenase n=1 Tax=unclassified Pantoea TaxID=2630326 RepID=UPI00142E5CFE|nr:MULTISPECIES: antibiotic biosynthesis monooxygenase [unclassified Pantoea]KAF6677724.1 antibiotic biosynthesis monooxygenase [Pantoea sp. EKM21T]KAF6683431.1 antibiotic biosynthesis monooxygenase [Pantoea sp. EKM22T]
MLIISGYMYIDPSVLEQFMGELKLLANAVRQRDGNLSYNAAVEDYQTGRLLISERWVDQDALNAHLIKTDTVEFINRWQGKMKGELFKYDAFNERGLMDG